MSLLEIIKSENDIFLEWIVEEYPETVTQITVEHFVLAVQGTCARFIKKLIKNGLDTDFIQKPLFFLNWDIMNDDWWLTIGTQSGTPFVFVSHCSLRNDNCLDMLKLALQLDCFKKSHSDFFDLMRRACKQGHVGILEAMIDCDFIDINHTTNGIALLADALLNGTSNEIIGLLLSRKDLKIDKHVLSIAIGKRLDIVEEIRAHPGWDDL